MAENLQIIDANTSIGIHPEHRLDMSIEKLVAQMDKYCIAASLTISTIAMFHESQTGNAVTIDSAKVSNRLVPVGTVNPRTYFGTEEEMRAIKGLGFRIFKFFPTEQKWAINSMAFCEVVRQLSVLKTPIMVETKNPGDVTALCPIISQSQAPVILCSVSLDTLSEAVAAMTRLPQTMIETCELTVPGGLEMLVERVTADRIVFGSGAPTRSTASSLHYVLDSELSETDKQKILGGNIRRVLEVC